MDGLQLNIESKPTIIVLSGQCINVYHISFHQNSDPWSQNIKTGEDIIFFYTLFVYLASNRWSFFRRIYRISNAICIKCYYCMTTSLRAIIANLNIRFDYCVILISQHNYWYWKQQSVIETLTPVISNRDSRLQFELTWAAVLFYREARRQLILATVLFYWEARWKMIEPDIGNRNILSKHNMKVGTDCEIKV